MNKEEMRDLAIMIADEIINRKSAKKTINRDALAGRVLLKIPVEGISKSSLKNIIRPYGSKINSVINCLLIGEKIIMKKVDVKYQKKPVTFLFRKVS